MAGGVLDWRGVDVDHCCFVWIFAPPVSALPSSLVVHDKMLSYVRINVEFGDCSRKRHFEDSAQGVSSNDSGVQQ